MPFTEDVIEKVWKKAPFLHGDGKTWGKDACGAWIQRSAYGNRESIYGWEIDHIDPKGGDALSNLQPLHWENNVAKSDSKELVCAVTSKDAANVPVRKSGSRN